MKISKVGLIYFIFLFCLCSCNDKESKEPVQKKDPWMIYMPYEMLFLPEENLNDYPGLIFSVNSSYLSANVKCTTDNGTFNLSQSNKTKNALIQKKTIGFPYIMMANTRLRLT